MGFDDGELQTVKRLASLDFNTVISVSRDGKWMCVGLVGRQGMGREVEGTDFMGAVWNQVRCSSGHLT